MPATDFHCILKLRQSFPHTLLMRKFLRCHDSKDFSLLNCLSEARAFSSLCKTCSTLFTSAYLLPNEFTERKASTFSQPLETSGRHLHFPFLYFLFFHLLFFFFKLFYLLFTFSYSYRIMLSLFSLSLSLPLSPLSLLPLLSLPVGSQLLIYSVLPLVSLVLAFSPLYSIFKHLLSF